MTISDTEAKTLKKILQEAHRIELNSSFTDQDLVHIKSLIQDLDQTANEILSKSLRGLSQLHSGMSLRQFLNCTVPLERLLDRNLRDDHFLVTSADSPKAILPKRDLYFVLDHLRSAFNVGSIFRLAECMAAKEVLLCGYTPGKENQTLVKTSLSAYEYVSEKRFSKAEEAITDLKKRGIRVVALETAKQALPLNYEQEGHKLLGPTAFVVGNERFGLDFHTLELCDEVRQIPVFGVKNSLNVANALSIAAYEWSRLNS